MYTDIPTDVLAFIHLKITVIIMYIGLSELKYHVIVMMVKGYMWSASGQNLETFKI